MSCGGYVILPTETVLKACRDWLKWREQRIEQTREEAIEYVMSKRRWFKPNRTREEAIAHLQRPHAFGSDWDDIAQRGWMQYQDVLQMQALAKTAMHNFIESVYVDGAMNSHLKKFLQGVEQ